MGLHANVEKVLVWDRVAMKMVQKEAIYVQLVGNRGTVFHEVGPLYVSNSVETREAADLLKQRLLDQLPGLQPGALTE